jgi:hypothetical protein
MYIISMWHLVAGVLKLILFRVYCQKVLIRMKGTKLVLKGQQILILLVVIFSHNMPIAQLTVRQLLCYMFVKLSYY